MGKPPSSFSNSRFEGKKGRIMLELQKSYRDPRFKLTNKFKDDIDIDKLPTSFKQAADKDIFKVDESEVQPKQKEATTEKSRQLELLEELGITKKITKEKRPLQIVHRFDPTTAKSQKLLKQLQADKRRKIIEENTKKKQLKKQTVVIAKGVDKAKLNIEKANRLLNDQPAVEPPQQPHKSFSIRVNGSKEEAFQPSTFRLF